LRFALRSGRVARSLRALARIVRFAPSDSLALRSRHRARIARACS